MRSEANNVLSLAKLGAKIFTQGRFFVSLKKVNGPLGGRREHGLDAAEERDELRDGHGARRARVKLVVH